MKSFFRKKLTQDFFYFNGLTFFRNTKDTINLFSYRILFLTFFCTISLNTHAQFCDNPTTYNIPNDEPFNDGCFYEGFIDLLALIYDCSGRIKVRPRSCASNYVVANEFSRVCNNSLFSPPIRKLKIQCLTNGTFLEGEVMFWARARRINTFSWDNAIVGSSMCRSVLIRCDQYEDCKPTPVALIPVAGTEDDEMALNCSSTETNSLLSLNMNNYKELFNRLLNQF